MHREAATGEETRGGETKIWSIETAARARAHALPSLAFGWYVALELIAVSVSLWSTGHRWSNRVLSIFMIGWKSFPIPRKIFEIILAVSRSRYFVFVISFVSFRFLIDSIYIMFYFRFYIAFCSVLPLIYLFVCISVFLQIW